MREFDWLLVGIVVLLLAAAVAMRVETKERLASAHADMSIARARFKEEVERLTPPSAPPMSDDERQAIIAAQCVHCGGTHLRKCPRVRRMKLRLDGGLEEVEFWADSAWSKDGIIWPEDVAK